MMDRRQRDRINRDARKTILSCEVIRGIKQMGEIVNKLNAAFDELIAIQDLNRKDEVHDET